MAEAATDSVLSDVFGGGAASEGPSSPEPASSSESTDSTKGESSPETGAETLPDTKGDESKETPPPSEDKPKEETKPAEDAEKKEDKPRTEEKEPAKDDKAAADKVKAEDLTFKQRFEETAKWGHALNEQNQQMRTLLEQQTQKLEMLQKKLDGTWTDEDDAKLERGSSTEEVATRAVQVGKALASKAALYRELGEAEATKVLTEYNQLFGGNETIRNIVANEESPAHAAALLVERYHFEQEHGRTPKEWKASIEKAYRTSMEKEIRKSILEEIRAGRNKREATPESLSEVRGSGDQGENGKLKEEQPTPLKDIF